MPKLASGIKVSEECVNKFTLLKGKGKNKQYNFVSMSINDELSEIAVDGVGALDTSYEDVRQMLTRTAETGQCKYVVVDYQFTFKGRPRDKVIMISWVPEKAGVKQRMLHSSSVGTVSSALKLSTVLQCNDLDDLDEEEITTRVTKQMKD